MSRLNNRPANKLKREKKRRSRGDYNNLSKILEVLDKMQDISFLTNDARHIR